MINTFVQGFIAIVLTTITCFLLTVCSALVAYLLGMFLQEGFLFVCLFALAVLNFFSCIILVMNLFIFLLE